MGQAVRSGYCKGCQAEVKVSKRTPNHVLHLFLSIFTAGLWVLVWLLLSLPTGGWRCEQCGRKARARSFR